MPPLPKILNESALRDAYVIKKMSINEIAKDSGNLLGTNVSNATVYQALKRIGIPTRSVADGVARARCQLDIDRSFMTETMIEWVDGFLLGDGRIGFHICNGKVRGARFSVGVLHREFAVYLMSGFENYRPSNPKQSGKVSKRCPNLMWGSATLSHPDIAIQAERWYGDGGKKTRIPKDVRITATSLLLWYLGDGSFHYDQNSNNSILRLATCCFDVSDIENILLPKLRAIGFECTRNESKNDIQILPKSTGAFFRFIGRSSPVQCYDYKFDVPSWMFLNRLTDVVSNDHEKWRAMYHIKKGEIDCIRSPGGNFVLLDDEQSGKLTQLIKKDDVSNIGSGGLVQLSVFAKTSTEKYNARWIARQKGIAINKGGFVLKDSVPILTQELRATGTGWAVPDEVISKEFDEARKAGFPYYEMDVGKSAAAYARLVEYEPAADAGGLYAWDGKDTELASFFHPHIFECRKKGKMSPIEFFNSDNDLRRGIWKLLCLYGKVTRSLLRDICRNEHASCRVNNFSPRVAKTVVRALFGSRPNLKVLDPCSGFSGRQLGCAASGTVSRYVGMDLSEKTHAGLISSKNFIASMGSVMESDVLCTDCIKGLMNIPETFDLVLTSPPFMDREEYAGVPFENSLGEWLDKFLRPLFVLCRNRLVKDGLMAMYLSETIGKSGSSNQIPNYAREIAAAEGLIEMPPIAFRIAQAEKARLGHPHRLTSVQVWRKD